MVSDVYKEISIKNVERSKRGEEAPKFIYILPGHNIKQWARFLKGTENKTAFITFLVGEWKKADYAHRLGKKVMCIGYDMDCVRIYRQGLLPLQVERNRK